MSSREFAVCFLVLRVSSREQTLVCLTTVLLRLIVFLQRFFDGVSVVWGLAAFDLMYDCNYTPDNLRLASVFVFLHDEFVLIWWCNDRRDSVDVSPKCNQKMHERNSKCLALEFVLILVQKRSDLCFILSCCSRDS